MTDLHIYSYPWQPFTDFDWSGIRVTFNPRRVSRCGECRDWRWCKYLKVQAYYDGWRVKCADGCYGENRSYKQKVREVRG